MTPAAADPVPIPDDLPEPLLVDERLLVFDKPTGLLSVPGIGPQKADCLVARAQHRWPGCRIVHRLDRDTSGVIVLARDAAAHRFLSIEFQERRVGKVYEAVVRSGGRPAGRAEDEMADALQADAGEIDLPIRKDLDDPPRQCVCHEHGRPSLTRWQVLERLEDRTRLELRPHTGRSHQLRLHLKAIGHPILGDDLYADPATRAMASRLLLHARELRFSHPEGGDELVVVSPPAF